MQVTKFVLLYDWEEDSGVLCPSFNITKIDQDRYGCLANFSSKACNRTIKLSLEAWTNNSILQPAYGQVYINCNLTNTQAPKEPEPQIKQTTNNTQISPGLADAVFSLLESIAPVLTGSSVTIRLVMDSPVVINLGSDTFGNPIFQKGTYINDVRFFGGRGGQAK